MNLDALLANAEMKPLPAPHSCYVGQGEINLGGHTIRVYERQDGSRAFDAQDSFNCLFGDLL